MSMLKTKSKLESYTDLLGVPPKPNTLIEAEQALRDAVAAREAGQVKHVEASRLLSRQVPGLAQQITTAQVDEIGQTLAALYSAEDAAIAAHEAEKEKYESETVARIVDGLSQLSAVIGERLNELDRLIDPAMIAGVEIRQSGILVRLPNTLIPRLGSLRGSIENMRRVLWDSRPGAKASDGPMPQAAWRRG